LARVAAAIGLGAAANGTAILATRSAGAAVTNAAHLQHFEDPALLELGRQVEQAAMIFHAAVAEKAAARARYDLIAPALPDVLIVERFGEHADLTRIRCSESERDAEDLVVIQPPLNIPRLVMSSDLIKLELEGKDGRTAFARMLRGWLRTAEGYENAVDDAKAAAGLCLAQKLFWDAVCAISDLAAVSHQLQVRSPTGLLIRARILALNETASQRWSGREPAGELYALAMLVQRVLR
jgi:hypothetical protein